VGCFFFCDAEDLQNEVLPERSPPLSIPGSGGQVGEKCPPVAMKPKPHVVFGDPSTIVQTQGWNYFRPCFDPWGQGTANRGSFFRLNGLPTNHPVRKPFFFRSLAETPFSVQFLVPWSFFFYPYKFKIRRNQRNFFFSQARCLGGGIRTNLADRAPLDLARDGPRSFPHEPLCPQFLAPANWVLEEGALSAASKGASPQRALVLIGRQQQ